MKDRTEWDLMCISEDLEPGDYVVVEEDGEEEVMIFVKERDSKAVILKDRAKNERVFSKLTLEEREGNALILRKHE